MNASAEATTGSCAETREPRAHVGQEGEIAAKVKRFVSAEIVSRFLHARPDYPRNDSVSLGMLWEAASEGLEEALPSLADVTDVCVLYDTVDSVADDMAAKYYVNCPISPDSSNSSEAMGPVRMFDSECDTLQERTLHHVTDRPAAHSSTDSEHQGMNNGLTPQDLE